MNEKVPEEVNWANKYQIPIRDQGACGSCWAMSGVIIVFLYSRQTF